MSKFNCFPIHSKCQAMCCKVVPIEEEVFDRNRDKIVRPVTNECRFIGHDVLEGKNKKLITPLTEDGYCPFLNQNLTCNIYEDRPSVCKKFGTECHKFMRCAYQDKDGKERSRQVRRSILREATKDFEKLVKNETILQERHDCNRLP